ncbi:transglycosylase SLT domain-containing protein [Actinomycetospora cinnamomea]|uniref:Type VII secretion system (Wss) protein ESAT-6 n=1 Tax=Actinomycetospora cinnamomea TaxID=663609 RepID=A0A2U1ECS2_9PSEU|nr:transglycosylase SLT domain-containing protein [Actinomycetospora cinnamomea]PVY97741.1 type VII secretion system (Wss) protein ESAT-6 [Actinomycetospora cinnamomea]
MPADPEAELAAEPAAAELAALAARVRTADPGAVHAAAAQVRAIGEGLGDTVHAVDRGAAAVAGRWRGEGATAFGDWVRAFGAAGGRDREVIAAAGSALDRVGTVLGELRHEVDQQVGRAVALAGAARARAAGVPDADRLAADALRAPTEAVRATIRRAEAELRTVATTLRGLAEGLTAYADLPRPEATTTPGTTTAPTSRPDPPRRSRPPVEDESRAGFGSAAPEGRVDDWIRRARAILQAAGVPPERMDPGAVATIIEHESGGDPEAVNTWDSNAEKGTPSQGLMQTIAPTFEAHKLPGHDDIRDPVDNIIAGVRYAIARYGSVSRVPGVLAEARGDPYVGY